MSPMQISKNIYYNLCIKNTDIQNCNMRYVANQDNSNYEYEFLSPSFLNIGYFIFLSFYTLFGYCSIKFIKYIKDKNKEEENENNFISTYKYQSNLLETEDQESKIINTMLSSLKNNNNVDFASKVIDNMLSSKTLERALVIYYIFVKKGNYKVASPDKELIVEYNSYLEYKSYDNYFLKLQGLEINDSLDENISYEVNKLFTLDKSLDADTNFSIGDKEYLINQGNLNMIAWIYSSGLYEYLTTNQEVKKEILKEMYDNKLLTGNLFLRYQLQQDLENPAPKL